MESFRIHRGVTLVEMMVVVAIIMILSGIVVTGTSAFQRTILLATTAYDIGLTMRTAENFGLGSRQQAGVSGNIGYGLHFDKNTPTSFFMFADGSARDVCHSYWPSMSTNVSGAPDEPKGNCHYGETGDVVVGSPYQLGNGVQITDLCIYDGTAKCGQSAIDLVFSRPSGNVFISDATSYSVSYSKASVKVTSSDGTRDYYICIGSLGDIQIRSMQCL